MPKLLQHLIITVLLSVLSVAQTTEVQRSVVLLPHSEPPYQPNLIWDKGSYASWIPSRTEIEVMEAKLPQISEMKIRGYESTPIRIEHPEKYFRQYIGVRHHGKRRIYVNAFRDDPPPSNWQKRFYVVMDGDLGCWHTFYDTETQTFSDLTINPRA
jgi:hypothetical protein